MEVEGTPTTLEENRPRGASHFQYQPVCKHTYRSARPIHFFPASLHGRPQQRPLAKEAARLVLEDVLPFTIDLSGATVLGRNGAGKILRTIGPNQNDKGAFQLFWSIRP